MSLIKPLILCIVLILLIYPSTYMVVSKASQPVGTDTIAYVSVVCAGTSARVTGTYCMYPDLL